MKSTPKNVAEIVKQERTTFDARLQYYDVLKMLMMAISKARVYGDDRARMNAIDELYIFVSPFMEESDDAKIGGLLSEAKKAMAESTMFSVRDQLFQHESMKLKLKASNAMGLAQKLLYAVMKKQGMLLPLAGASEDMFDEEKFLRDSDL